MAGSGIKYHVSSIIQNTTMKRLFRLAVILGLLALIGWAAYNMGVITYKKYALQKQILELQAQAAALAQKHADLTSFLDSFKDPAMLEQQLRKRLNLKKEGENVVVIVPGNAAGADQTRQQVSQTADQLLQNITAVELQKGKNVLNWQKWWQAFFGTPP